MVITQVGQFPKGKHDDLVDTVSMAIKHLRDIGVLIRGSEWAAEGEADMMFQSNNNFQPLYPA